MSASAQATRASSRRLFVLGSVQVIALAALGWWTRADFPFPGLALFGAAFVAYAAAAWRADNDIDHRLLIWVFAIGMRLVLVPLTPELSDDIYRYLWDGHVQLSGMNPYIHEPAADALAHLRTPYHGLINNPTVPTIYPPLTQMAFLLIALAGSSLLAAKILWLACDVATAAVLVRIARRTGRNEQRVLLLYLWSPLLVVEVAWSGHLEPLGMLMMALAILFASGINDAPGDAGVAPGDAGVAPDLPWARLGAGTALALAALTKFAPAAALPALLRRAGWRPLVGFGLASVLLYLPYVSAGGDLFTGLRTYSEHWWFMKGPFVVIESVTGDPLIARRVMAGIMIGIIGWTAARRFDLERALLWVLGAGMILTPTLHPWYVLWMLPMAALRSSRPWILLSGLAFIGYCGLGAYQEIGEWPQPGLARAAMWLPFLALLAFDSARGMLDAKTQHLGQSG
jgi:alpha-1,6-mannosyltransferase